jgi:hypothetical protein
MISERGGASWYLLVLGWDRLPEASPGPLRSQGRGHCSGDVVARLEEPLDRVDDGTRRPPLDNQPLCGRAQDLQAFLVPARAACEGESGVRDRCKDGAAQGCTCESGCGEKRG